MEQQLSTIILSLNLLNEKFDLLVVDVRVLKQDVAVLKKDLVSLRRDLTALEKRVTTNHETQLEMHQVVLKAVEGPFLTLESDYKKNKRKVSRRLTLLEGQFG